MKFLCGLLWLCLLLGCAVPPESTYSTDNLSQSLERILREEYHIPIVSKLSGQTLWIYLPIEDEIFIESDKPREYVKLFEIKSAEGNLQGGILSVDYDVREIPESRERQDKKFNPEVSDKINKVLRAIRRVLFSLKRGEDDPKFFVIAASDIKNGIDIIYTTYIDDLRKAFYGIISWTEYQHRNVEDIKFSPGAIGDKEGRHIEFRDINFMEFVVRQIQQRVYSKFNRPQVKKGVDIDKEVLKTVRKMLEIYKVEDFLLVSLKNLYTGNKVTLSKAAVLEEVKE
jgi:hypothetical protein